MKKDLKAARLLKLVIHNLFIVNQSSSTIDASAIFFLNTIFESVDVRSRFLADIKQNYSYLEILDDSNRIIRMDLIEHNKHLPIVTIYY